MSEPLRDEPRDAGLFVAQNYVRYYCYVHFVDHLDYTELDCDRKNIA